MLLKLKWIIVWLLWFYVIARAYTVPITHDEAYSFLLIKTNYIKAMAGTANTHWLNSLGMKLGSILLGDKPWQLRIFSILAWLLYGYSAIKVSEKLKTKLLGFALFVALTANPFLLDFFSLARGYGLTCAFVLACIWKIIEAITNRTWKVHNWVPALLFASLAVFSNYTAFYFFLSFVIAFVVFTIMNKEWQQFWPLTFDKWWILVIGTSVIAITNLLFIKLYTGDLEYGGDSGFINSILGSLVRGSLYNLVNEKVTAILTIIIAFLMLICFASAIFTYWKNRQVSPFIFLSLVIILMLGFTIFFHVAFATPYLLSRTTLIFYPCIMVMFFYWFDSLRLPAFSTATHIAFSSMIILLFGWLYIKSFNLEYCYEWKDQADTDKCLDIAVKDNAKKVLLQKWHAGVYINYYSVAEKGKYNFSIKTFLPDEAVNLTKAFCDTFQHYDHILLLPPYDLQAMHNKGLEFDVLKQFPVTRAAVLRIRQSK